LIGRGDGAWGKIENITALKTCATQVIIMFVKKEGAEKDTLG